MKSAQTHLFAARVGNGSCAHLLPKAQLAVILAAYWALEAPDRDKQPGVLCGFAEIWVAGQKIAGAAMAAERV